MGGWFSRWKGEDEESTEMNVGRMCERWMAGSRETDLMQAGISGEHTMPTIRVINSYFVDKMRCRFNCATCLANVSPIVPVVACAKGLQTAVREDCCGW